MAFRPAMTSRLGLASGFGEETKTEPYRYGVRE
jgi:hypothetical protein